MLELQLSKITYMMSLLNLTGGYVPTIRTQTRKERGRLLLPSEVQMDSKTTHIRSNPRTIDQSHQHGFQALFLIPNGVSHDANVGQSPAILRL